MSDEPKIPIGDPSIGVTTAAPASEKSAVQPYSARPMLELREGSFACGACGYSRFRRSKVRFGDVKELIMMRFPMRCLRCGKREYHDVVLAMLSGRSKEHGRLSEGTDTWKSWTRSSSDVPTSARPLSTAQGTRAERLHRPAESQTTPRRRHDDVPIE
jgi:ribosomal protein L37E